MYTDATLYSTNHSMQERDTKELLPLFVSRMNWKNNEELVMDIGCGSGDTTLKLLLPALPCVERITAVDALPSMIEYAKAHNSHPKIEYHVANILDDKTLAPWKESQSKVFSIYCLNWVQDQERALKNVFLVLRKGGEALIHFYLKGTLSPSLKPVFTSSKWSKCLKEEDLFIPVSEREGYGSSHYRELCEKCGFVVLAYDEKEKEFSFRNDEECKALLLYRNASAVMIPKERLEEFTDDLFEAFMKYNNRDKDGHPMFHYSSLTLHVLKPSAVI